MKTKLMFCILAFVFASTMMLPAARADQWDHATKLTFSQSVQIPGHVLPAGTYWFMRADKISPNIVQVFNSNRSMLYATIETVNAEHPTITDNTAITFAERGTMQPEALLSWFYPGDSSGHEFVYPKPERQELAQVKHHTIMAMAGDKRQTVAAGD